MLGKKSINNKKVSSITACCVLYYIAAGLSDTICWLLSTAVLYFGHISIRTMMQWKGVAWCNESCFLSCCVDECMCITYRVWALLTCGRDGMKPALRTMRASLSRAIGKQLKDLILLKWWLYAALVHIKTVHAFVGCPILCFVVLRYYIVACVFKPFTFFWHCVAL